MTPEIMNFGKSLMLREEVFSKRLIEFGSYNVNGSFSTFLDKYTPAEYVAIDLQECDHYKNGVWQANNPAAKHLARPCVNRVMDTESALQEYGRESFDLVISTEMLEHVKDWKGAIRAMKHILKPEGYLVLSTRTPGFPLHNYPDDYWRFTLDDMKRTFSDFDIHALHAESLQGLFIKAKKPVNFVENNLNFNVHSMKFKAYL